MGTIDGVFAADQDARFFEASDLTQDDIRDLTMKIRKRTLAEKRHGLMDSSDAEDMLQWEHDGGFSLDTSMLTRRGLNPQSVTMNCRSFPDPALLRIHGPEPKTSSQPLHR